MRKRLFFLGLISIVLCIVLTGCGVENKPATGEEQADEMEQKVYNAVTPTTDEAKEVIQEMDLYSDNTKMVFISGQTRLVFYYSGEEITGYVTYIDYGNEATAENALTLVDEEDESIEKAYTKGKYLVMEYDKSEYENLSVSDVKNAYSYLKEATK